MNHKLNHNLNLNEIIDISGWAKGYLKDKPINKRAKIDTGKFCNRSCFFCYYYNDLNSKDFLSPLNAGVLAGYLLDRGIEEIELSGGEPTAHPKILEVVKSIKNEFIIRNLVPKISIVTNGSLSTKLFEKLQVDIKEWLFSIHGDDETHDKIVGVRGSYTNIIEILTHSIDINPELILRFNFVVTDNNLCSDSIEFLRTMLMLGYQVNLLPLNFWKDAKNLESDDRQLEKIYESINNFVERVKVLSCFSNPLNNRLLNIRYPQFCLLTEDARKFARGHYDHLVDLTDWNKIYYPRDTNPKDKILSTEPINPSTIYPDRTLSNDNLVKIAKVDRNQSHYKDTICNGCKDFNRCDGIKKTSNTSNASNGLKKLRILYTMK